MPECHVYIGRATALILKETFFVLSLVGAKLNVYMCVCARGLIGGVNAAL